MLPAIKHQSELSYYLGTQIDEGLCQRPSCLCLLITATTVRFVRSRSGVSWGAVPNDPLFPVGCNLARQLVSLLVQNLHIIIWDLIYSPENRLTAMASEVGKKIHNVYNLIIYL